MPQRREKQEPKSVFDSLYDSLSKRLSKSLYEQVVGTRKLEPIWTTSKFLAFALAALVHATLFLFAVLGIFLLVRYSPNLIAILGALICFALAWFFFPRFPKIEGEILVRAQYPTLYQIADRVAQALGSPILDGIVINARYNAMFGQVGWRRKRIMYLGLPLFWTLDGQERLALIGHEIAHGVNGDPARGFFLATAIDTLERWHFILATAQARVVSDGSIFGFIAYISGMIGGILMRMLAVLPWLGSYAMATLFFRESQRAEYLADYLGATVSGSDAAISTLAKLQRGGDAFWGMAQRLALSQTQKNLFDELRENSIPGYTRPSTEISFDDPDARIDATHPPTSFRVGFLRAHPMAGAKVVVSAAQWDAVDRELAPLQQDIQQKLFDSYQRSLYV